MAFVKYTTVLQNTDGTRLHCPFLSRKTQSPSWEITPQMGKGGCLLTPSDSGDFGSNLFYFGNEKILHVWADLTGMVITLVLNSTDKHTAATVHMSTSGCLDF